MNFIVIFHFSDPKKFKEFISLEMTLENVLNYVKELEKMCYTKFNINENDILNFPDFIDDIDDILNNPKKLKQPQQSQPNVSQQQKLNNSKQQQQTYNFHQIASQKNSQQILLN